VILEKSNETPYGNDKREKMMSVILQKKVNSLVCLNPQEKDSLLKQFRLALTPSNPVLVPPCLHPSLLASCLHPDTFLHHFTDHRQTQGRLQPFRPNCETSSRSPPALPSAPVVQRRSPSLAPRLLSGRCIPHSALLTRGSLIFLR
jgi:hypothetical protein